MTISLKIKVFPKRIQAATYYLFKTAITARVESERFQKGTIYRILNFDTLLSKFLIREKKSAKIILDELFIDYKT